MSSFKRSTKITTASAAASPMSSPRNSTSGDRPARMAQLQQIRDDMMTIDMSKAISVCPSQPFGLTILPAVAAGSDQSATHLLRPLVPPPLGATQLSPMLAMANSSTFTI
ncbi:hypothetical protein BG000_011769 [Podila horticola]|nr:hypothetical protein BG000_011769 [Podila horticola]